MAAYPGIIAHGLNHSEYLYNINGAGSIPKNVIKSAVFKAKQ